MTTIYRKTNKDMRITVSKSPIVILLFLFICIPESLGQDVYTIRDVYATNYSVDPQAFAFYPGDAPTPFAFSKWGHYNTERCDGEEYFTGYSDGPLYELSASKHLPDGQGCRILLDDSRDKPTGDVRDHLNNPACFNGYRMALGEGYELSVKDWSYPQNKMYIQLTKNGAAVDYKVISEAREYYDTSPIKETTYIYSRPMGGSDYVVQIAAHFYWGWGHSYHSDGSMGSTLVPWIDGLWQISDQPIEMSGHKLLTGMIARVFNPDEPQELNPKLIGETPMAQLKPKPGPKPAPALYTIKGNVASANGMP